MEWMLMNPAGLKSVAYELPDIELLETLLKLLQDEDVTTRSARVQLGLSKVVQLQILPLILSVKDDPAMLQASIKLLENMTRPVNVLLSPAIVKSRSKAHARLVKDLTQMLQQIQDAVCKMEIGARIVEILQTVTGEAGKYPLDDEALDLTVLSLHLLANLLKVPTSSNPLHAERSRGLLRNLLRAGLGNELLMLLHSPSVNRLVVAIAQLLNVIYKHQNDHLFTAKMLPRYWSSRKDIAAGGGARDKPEDGSTRIKSRDCSYSSYDDEPQGGAGKKKSPLDYVGSDHICSDSGLSMKSMDVDDDDEDDRDDDDDDDEEASRREDALSVMDTCAGGENSLRLDSSIESNPLENELGDLLCIFTVQFLKHGFAQLVNNLQASLLRSNYNYNGISYEQAESYFLWTLMFFSKFAVMEEVGWDPVEPAYSAEIFSYLTYLAVDYSERYLVSLKIDESAARVYWKQLHNVLMAMYELLAVLDTFMMEEGLNGNKNFITSLQVRLTASYDIRMLYVLLIRLHKNNSNDDEQTLDFLSKAIMTNHRLLLMMENVVNSQNNAAAATTLTFNMLAHVKNFATESMMAQYGKLLTRFRQNTDFLNDCLLTMMHHVAGDCQQPNMLLQIPIIETFTAICDENHKLQENYDDLIDYTFSKFLVVAKTGFDEAIHSDATESSDWTLEETEKLSMYYLRYMDKPDMLTMVWSGLNLDKTHKTKNAVLARLTELGLVHFSDELTHSMLNDASVGEFDRERGDINDYISFCVQKLHKEKRSEHVEWLQNTLLEACYIKLGGSRLTRNSPQEEPVTLYYTKFGRCIPLLPYTDAQENVLSNKFFRHILVSFGFDLGERGEFPRIPHAFTANQLYEKAKLLTPEIDASRLKFTMDDLLAESSAKSTNYSKDFDEIMHDAAESFNRSTPHSPPAMPSSLWAMSIGRINNVVSQKTTNSQQRSPVAST